MTYQGGKSGYGVYQKIINQIPPHEIYIEPFLGGGGIMRNKRLAVSNIGIDLDMNVINKWRSKKNIELHQTCAIEFLKKYKYTGNEFIYADPPYLIETRTGKFRYKYEFSNKEHEELLLIFKRLPCKIMLSGYESDLYKKELIGYRTMRFQIMTRGGYTKTECLWMNYPEPTALHDYKYLGSNFRERERITRKKKRLIKKLKKMPKLERQSMLAAIQEVNFEEAQVD